MKLHITRTAAVLAALALIGLAGAGDASAHERRTVAGRYTFVVGWLTEPALLEEPNGLDLRITNVQTNEPVEGAEKSLKADVTAGGQTRTFELKARFGQRGAYTADLIPTRAGSWSFRFYGTLDGTPIDERFESGPGRFDDVRPKGDLQFPAQVPSAGELAQRLGQPAEAGRPAAEPSPDVQRALDRADQARTTAIAFGVAGIAVGLAGTALAVYALAASRRGRATTGREGEPV